MNVRELNKFVKQDRSSGDVRTIIRIQLPTIRTVYFSQFTPSVTNQHFYSKIVWRNVLLSSSTVNRSTNEMSTTRACALRSGQFHTHIFIVPLGPKFVLSTSCNPLAAVVFTCKAAEALATSAFGLSVLIADILVITPSLPTSFWWNSSCEQSSCNTVFCVPPQGWAERLGRTLGGLSTSSSSTGCLFHHTRRRNCNG